MLLRKGLEAALKQVLTKLSTLSEDIEGNKKRVAEVATISAGDSEIGNLIAESLKRLVKTESLLLKKVKDYLWKVKSLKVLPLIGLRQCLYGD